MNKEPEIKESGGIFAEIGSQLLNKKSSPPINKKLNASTKLSLSQLESSLYESTIYEQ
jgi:hypothetical protein